MRYYLRKYCILSFSIYLRCYLCSRDRCGDSEGESLAISHQQGSGGSNWPPDQPEDSDNQRNVRQSGQTSIQIPPVTVTSPPGETTLIQSQYQVAHTGFYFKSEAHLKLMEQMHLGPVQINFC